MRSWAPTPTVPAMGRNTETTADTLWELFRRTAIATPDREAIIDARRGERLTYDELHDHVRGFVGALRTRGVGEGDTYATILNNGLEQTSAIIAPTALGAVANTVNYRQSPDAIVHILEDSGARVVLFDEANRETVASVRDELRDLAYLYAGEDPPPWADSYAAAVDEHVGETPPTPELAVDDPVYLLYTSGTTGVPKGCRYTNGRTVEMILQVMTEFRLGGDRALLIVPQAHAGGGVGGGTLPLFRGGTVVTLPDFHPVRALELIEEESLSYLIAVPAMLRAMVAAGPGRFETASMETVVTFGSPLAADLAREVVEAFDLEYFGNHMGATEIAWFLTRDVREDLEAAASPGTAALNVETRVVALDDGEAGDPAEVCEVGETGELVVDTPYGMDGYLNRPEATAEAFRDGWYYTGDVGHLDEDGRFWPEGRKTNMIISGGINVSDVNVERVLGDHPAAAEVAVVGVPDDRWGERVVAAVVPGDEGLTEEDLQAWCRDRDDLADFQRPKEVVLVDGLPRGATGKVQKFKLEEMLAG